MLYSFHFSKPIVPHAGGDFDLQWVAHSSRTVRFRREEILQAKLKEKGKEKEKSKDKKEKKDKKVFNMHMQKQNPSLLPPMLPKRLLNSLNLAASISIRIGFVIFCKFLGRTLRSLARNKMSQSSPAGDFAYMDWLQEKKSKKSKSKKKKEKHKHKKSSSSSSSSESGDSDSEAQSKKQDALDDGVDKAEVLDLDVSMMQRLRCMHNTYIHTYTHACMHTYIHAYIFVCVHL
jgi:hypothetical protein